MESLLPIDVLSRWVHVGTAIVLVGGSVFMRFVLMPAAGELPDEAHNQLRDRVLGTWKRFVGIGIALFLISGLFNYFRAIPKHQGEALYHALMGVKIIVALGVFFLAAALTGRSKALEPIRQDRKKWLSVLIALATIVVLLAGFLKVAVPPKTESPPAASATVDGG